MTANVWDDNITVMFGNGDGTFQSEMNYSITLGNYINVGDFNADGYPDIVMTGTDSVDTAKLLIVFFINDGDGTFTRGTDIDFSALDRPFALVAKDLNNDGKIDLATSNYNDMLNIFLKHVDRVAPFVSFAPEIPLEGTIVKGTILIPAYALDDDSGVKDLSLFENNNFIQSVQTDSYSFAVDTTTLADGVHIFKVLSSDNKGNESFIERSYIVDNTSPTATLSAPAFSTNVSVTSGFTLSWGGGDSTSGIEDYQLQYRAHKTTAWSIHKVDEGDWTIKKSVKFTLGQLGYTYYLKAKARDKAGNEGSFSSVKYTIIPYDNPSLSYSSKWKNATSTYGYKNTLRYSSTKGAYATFSFAGKSITLIAPKGASKGKVAVFIRNKSNGTWSKYSKIKTIDLYSKTAKNRAPIAIKSWTSSSTHQVKFMATGTKNFASKGTRVDIDGIAVLK